MLATRYPLLATFAAFLLSSCATAPAVDPRDPAVLHQPPAQYPTPYFRALNSQLSTLN